MGAVEQNRRLTRAKIREPGLGEGMDPESSGVSRQRLWGFGTGGEQKGSIQRCYFPSSRSSVARASRFWICNAPPIRGAIPHLLQSPQPIRVCMKPVDA